MLPVGIVVSGALFGAMVFDYLDRRLLVVSYDEHIFASLELENSPLEGSKKWKPNFGSGSASSHRNVRFRDILVTIYITTYLASLADSELLRIDRTLVDSRYWTLRKENQSPELPHDEFGAKSNIVLVNSRDGLTNLAVMYWFDVGGRQEKSRLSAKMRGLLKFFALREDSSAIVLVSECENNCVNEIEAIRALASHVFLGTDGKYRSVVRERIGRRPY